MALHQGIYTLCKGDQNEITEYLGALSVFDNSSVSMLFRRLLASIYSTAFQHLTHELLWTAGGFLFIYLDKGRIQSVCSSSKCQRCKGSTPTTSGAYLLTGACVPSQRSNPTLPGSIPGRNPFSQEHGKDFWRCWASPSSITGHHTCIILPLVSIWKLWIVISAFCCCSWHP